MMNRTTSEGGVTLRNFTPAIWIAERMLADGVNVCALVVFGTECAVVIDTLARPEDMNLVLDLLDNHGLPAFVVNTHGDWDHTWGNGAFANETIIAHRLCRASMLGQGPRVLARKRAEEPGEFDNVIITPPTVTFKEFMDIDLGGLTLSIQHLPGHTADEVVVHLPELGILIAGDAAEWPIPTAHDGPLGPWAAMLRQWAAREDVATVIPSHGPISDVDLLLDNADYLEALLDNPDLDWQAPPDAPDFYNDAHALNATIARRERERGGARR